MGESRQRNCVILCGRTPVDGHAGPYLPTPLPATMSATPIQQRLIGAFFRPNWRLHSSAAVGYVIWLTSNVLEPSSVEMTVYVCRSQT